VLFGKIFSSVQTGSETSALSAVGTRKIMPRFTNCAAAISTHCHRMRASKASLAMPAFEKTMPLERRGQALVLDSAVLKTFTRIHSERPMSPVAL